MKRILVVDDDDEFASVLAFALQQREYIVELAANGSDALQRVRRARFDVVVLDWTMPVMDGAAFLLACRREAAANSLPVVVVSAAPEAATHGLRLGAAAVLPKPFRFDELEQVLARLIRAPENDRGR